jgi:hypothetical protein
MLFLCSVPHWGLSFTQDLLLYYLEVNYHVYYCLSFELFIIYMSHDRSKLLKVIEAISDNAISF